MGVIRSPDAAGFGIVPKTKFFCVNVLNPNIAKYRLGPSKQQKAAAVRVRKLRALN